MSNFNINGYEVLKNVVSKDNCEFLYNYALVKKQVCETFRKHNYISRFNHDYGYFEDIQALNTYSCYGDIAMDTLMLKIKPLLQDKLKLQLTENYSYFRVYKKDDVLVKHKDRPSCEISSTINLGGDSWPIYVEPDNNKGYWENQKYIPSSSKGIEINLSPGDMLIYKGCEFEHWRNKFEGDECVQVFVHYNDVNSDFQPKKLFDDRPHIGLPSWFRDFKD